MLRCEHSRSCHIARPGAAHERPTTVRVLACPTGCWLVFSFIRCSNSLLDDGSRLVYVATPPYPSSSHPPSLPLHLLVSYWMMLIHKNSLSSSYYLGFENQLWRYVYAMRPTKTRLHLHIFWRYDVKTGPIFREVIVNLIGGDSTLAIRLLIRHDSKSCNRYTAALLVINQAQLDWPRQKGFSCKRIEKHKQEDVNTQSDYCKYEWSKSKEGFKHSIRKD